MSKFNSKTTNRRYKQDLAGIKIKFVGDEIKIVEKTRVLRDKTVKKIIFEDSLRKYENDKNGQRSISSFFT